MIFIAFLIVAWKLPRSVRHGMLRSPFGTKRAGVSLHSGPTSISTDQVEFLVPIETTRHTTLPSTSDLCFSASLRGLRLIRVNAISSTSDYQTSDGGPDIVYWDVARFILHGETPWITPTVSPEILMYISSGRLGANLAIQEVEEP